MKKNNGMIRLTEKTHFKIMYEKLLTVNRPFKYTPFISILHIIDDYGNT